MERRWVVHHNFDTVAPADGFRSAGANDSLFLFLVHYLVVGLDHIILWLGAARGTSSVSAARCARSAWCTLLARCALRALVLRVERLAGLAERLAELLLRGLDLVHVVAAESLPSTFHGRVE